MLKHRTEDLAAHMGQKRESRYFFIIFFIFANSSPPESKIQMESSLLIMIKRADKKSGVKNPQKYFCFSDSRHIKYTKSERQEKIMIDKYPEWLENAKRQSPKANEKVLRFIYDFRTMQKTGESEDVLYKQFSSGYCYYFAHMLQAAFGRGEVCWAAPYGHIVWVDEEITFRNI